MSTEIRYNYKFTKFHSKELFRALKTLSSKEFFVFLTLNRLILQFNCKKNFRRLSMTELLSEIPFEMSERTLSRCLKTLIDMEFIKRFISKETGNSVFSLIKAPTSYSYSKVDDYILIDLVKKGRGVLDIKLASFLMVPTFITEYITLTFACLFYLNLGFSISISILAALCVELFFMMASGSNKILLQSLRWVIFAYSAFTVCHSTYVSDPKIQLLKTSDNTNIKRLEFQLQKQIDLSKTLKRRQEGLFADMEIYRKNELITKGRAQLAEEKRQLARELLQNDRKIEEISSKITALSSTQINRGIFSKESLKLVEVRTWSVMIFLVLIQLLSSVCTNEFFHSYRNYKRKRRTKKQYFKEDIYGLATAHLNLH